LSEPAAGNAGFSPPPCIRTFSPLAWLASERLEERSGGLLALRLETRWRDRTTHILMGEASSSNV